MFFINKITTCSFIFIFTISLIACNKKAPAADQNNVNSNDSLTLSEGDTSILINYSSPDADEKILIKFQPEIGKTYYVTNNSTYTSFQSRDTMKSTAVSKKYSKMKLSVLGIEKDQYKIEFTIVDARKSIKGDSISIDYTYGKALADPAADIDRKIEDCMVNTPLTIFMNSSGVGTDILGYEKIIEKVRAIIKAEAPADFKEIPDQYIASQIGAPTDNLENFFIAYPDTAVKIGDTWHITNNTVLQGVPIILTNNYTLADRKDGILYINFNTDIIIDKKQIPENILSQMGNMKFTAYVKGTGEIEEKTGWPLIMKISQGMELSDSFDGHTESSKQTNTGIIRTTQ